MSNLVYTSTYLLDAVHLSGSVITSLETGSSAPQYFFGTRYPLSFEADAEYSFRSNILCLKTNTDYNARMDVYLVGNAFPSLDSYGTCIATYECDAGLNRAEFYDQSVNFTALVTGTAHLRFVVYSGDWYVSSVGIFSVRESGFNPDAVSVTLPVVGKRFELLQFKAELFDPNSNIVPIEILSDEVFFDGGNLVIRGGDNRLAGRIVLVPSGSGPILGTDSSGSYIGIVDSSAYLPRPVNSASVAAYTGPSIVTMYSGSAPYTASFAGPAIGFQIIGMDSESGVTSYLDFNSQTGRLTIMGEINFLPGTLASSSLFGASGSGTGTLALSQIQNLINGIVFDNTATFIRGDLIYSPVIAGKYGYISQSFGVGDISGNRGIVLTALGYKSGSLYYSDAPAIYIGGDTGSFASASTPFFVASGSTGPLFSLGDLLYIQMKNGALDLVVSGTLNVYTGSGYVDVRTYVGNISSSFSSYLSWYSASVAAMVSSSIGAYSSSIAQLSASFLDFTSSVFWPYSASQAEINALQAANNYAQSSSIAQVSASFLNFTSSVFWPFSASQAQINAANAALTASYSASIAQLSASFLDFTSSQYWVFSASQALNNAIQTASIYAQSASMAQLSASFLDFTSSQYWVFSASQAANNAMQTASISAQSASISQLSSSFLGYSSSDQQAFVNFSSSQASINAMQTSSIASVSTSLAQKIEDRSVVDAVNKIKLPVSQKTQPGLYLETSSLGFWQTFPSGGLILSGNQQWNFPVVINSDGQFRIAHSQSWDWTNNEFSESIAMANEALRIRVSRLSIATPGLSMASTRSAANLDTLNYIKLGGGGTSSNLQANPYNDLITGSYMDGGGNFRIGYAGQHIFFSTTAKALFISSSYFQFTGGTAGSDQLYFDPLKIQLGNPMPDQYNPISKAGFYVNRSGQFFVGSGSVDPTWAGQGTGSWLSFDGSNLNVRLSKMFLFTDGIRVQGVPSSEPIASNVIKLGVSASNLTDTFSYDAWADAKAFTGSYMDGAGNFRIGTRNTHLVYSNAGGGALFITSSYFRLLAGSPSSIQINPVFIALGSTAATGSIPAWPYSGSGFIVSNTGEFWVGSGSIDSGRAVGGSGSYLHYVPNLGGRGVLQLKTDALFVKTTGFYLLSSGSGSTTNVIKLSPTIDAIGSSTTADSATGSYIDGSGAFRFGYRGESVEFLPNSGLLISSSYFNLRSGTPTVSLSVNPTFIALGSVAASGSLPNWPYSGSGFIVSNTGEMWVGSGSIDATRAAGGSGSYLHYIPNLGGRGVLHMRTDALYIKTPGFYLLSSGSGSTTNVIKLSPTIDSIGSSTTADSATGSYLDGSGAFRFGYRGESIEFLPSNGLLISSSYFNLRSGNTLRINPTFIAVGGVAASGSIPNWPTWNTGFIVSNTGEMWVGSGSIDPTRAVGGSGSYFHYVPNLGGGGVVQLKSDALFIKTTGTYLLASGAQGVTNVLKMVASGSSVDALTSVLSDGYTGSYIDGTGAFRFGYRGAGIQFNPNVAPYSLFISASYFNLKAGTGLVTSDTLEINPTFISLGDPMPPGGVPWYPASASGFIVSNTGELWIGSGSPDPGRAIGGSGSYLHYNPNLAGGGVIQLKTNALFIGTSNTLLMASGSGGATNVLKFVSGSVGTAALTSDSNTDTATGSYIDGNGAFRFGYRGEVLQGVPGSGFFLSSSYFNLRSGTPITLRLNPYYIAVGTVAALGNIPTSGWYSGFIASYTGDFWMGSGSIDAGRAVSGTGSYIHLGDVGSPARKVLQIKTEALFVSTSNTYFLASGSRGDTQVLRMVGTGSGGTVSPQSLTYAPWSDNITGSYIDGAGNFRVGYKDSHVVFSSAPTLGASAGAVFISSSWFNLNANTAGNQLQINPYFIALGNPMPITHTPTSVAVGLFADVSGNIFIGSGSPSTTSGSWLSLTAGGATPNLRIRSERTLLTIPNKFTLDAGWSSADTASVALGIATSKETGSGIWLDSLGNFRAGQTIGTDSSYIYYNANTGKFTVTDLIASKITGSNFYLNDFNPSSEISASWVRANEIVAHRKLIAGGPMDGTKGQTVITFPTSSAVFVVYSGSSSASLFEIGPYEKPSGIETSTPGNVAGSPTSVSSGSIIGNTGPATKVVWLYVSTSINLGTGYTFTGPGASGSIYIDVLPKLYEAVADIDPLYSWTVITWVSASWTSMPPNFTDSVGATQLDYYNETILRDGWSSRTISDVEFNVPTDRGSNNTLYLKIAAQHLTSTAV